MIYSVKECILLSSEHFQHIAAGKINTKLFYLIYLKNINHIQYLQYVQYTLGCICVYVLIVFSV